MSWEGGPRVAAAGTGETEREAVGGLQAEVHATGWRGEVRLGGSKATQRQAGRARSDLEELQLSQISVWPSGLGIGLGGASRGRSGLAPNR